MANTYYDSQLTAEEIEVVLEAINGILTLANNGKVLAINNGKLEARSVQWGGGGAVVQPLSVTQNGTYNPPSGVDGYAPVTVNVSGGGSEDGIIYSAGTLEKQSLFIPQSVGNASISFNQDHLYINTNADAYGGMIFVSTKAFDHNQFSNVKMEYSLDALAGGLPSFLGIRSNIDQSLNAGGIITPLTTGFPDHNNVQKRIDFSSAATKTVITLDVSDVTNDFVVEVSGFYLRGFRIYKLWLE